MVVCYVRVFSDPTPVLGAGVGQHGFVAETETVEAKVARLLLRGDRGQCALIENPPPEWK